MRSGRWKTLNDQRGSIDLSIRNYKEPEGERKEADQGQGKQDGGRDLKETERGRKDRQRGGKGGVGRRGRPTGTLVIPLPGYSEACGSSPGSGALIKVGISIYKIIPGLQKGGSASLQRSGMQAFAAFKSCIVRDLYFLTGRFVKCNKQAAGLACRSTAVSCSMTEVTSCQNSRILGHSQKTWTIVPPEGPQRQQESGTWGNIW